MARLVPGKGVDDLLIASTSILGQGGRLRIAGDGSERTKLEVLAMQLGVRSQVEFLGWVVDPNAFWSSCDVAVVPSHELVESFGLAALEAMASGRPVVATRNGGLSELVAEDEVGLIVPPGDTGALAAALQRYMDDAGLRTAHGLAARTRSEARFDIRRCARSYLALFDDREAA
jgi:glycosyltransferase involved in cell wall biosynthesis